MVSKSIQTQIRNNDFKNLHSALKVTFYFIAHSFGFKEDYKWISTLSNRVQVSEMNPISSEWLP